MPITKSFAGLSMLGLGMMPFGDFESIATVTVGSGGATSISFSSIPATYKHLQIRGVLRSDAAFNVTGSPAIRFNGATTGYAAHRLLGSGSAASASSYASETYIVSVLTAGDSAGANIFGGAIIDILDYADTSKNTTMRALLGTDTNGDGDILILSGLWTSTAAVNEVSIMERGGPSFMQYSTLSLYGIKG